MSSTPGSDLAANYTVTNAIATSSASTLGRSLSSGNVTVNLIAPNTIFADRRNNLDLRFAKIVRFAGRRAKLVLRERVDGQGYFKGRLGGVDGNDVTIEGDDGRPHRVPFGVAARGACPTRSSVAH